MQVVINISKGRYEDILSGKEFTIYQSDIREALKNGTPLPEGHGDLVDVDALIGKIHRAKSILAVLDAETIVEADKGED